MGLDCVILQKSFSHLKKCFLERDIGKDLSFPRERDLLLKIKYMRFFMFH